MKGKNVKEIMKKSLFFIRKNIKMIVIVLVVLLLTGIGAYAAGTYLFNSSDVKYNNTTSGVQSGDVQGAIDELYACASNYAAYNNRLTNAENTIGNNTLTTTSQTLTGGINELNDQIASKSYSINDAITFDTGITFHGGYGVIKNGRVVTLSFSVTKSDNSPFTGIRVYIGSLNSAIRPESFNVVTPVSGNIAIDSYVDGIAGNMLIISNNMYVDLVRQDIRQIQVFVTYIK